MRVLLFYPNLYGMNTLPPAFGYFTALLRQNGHEVALFDTTVYEGLYGSIDTDKKKSENLNARPFDDTLLKQSARRSNAEEDFRNEIVRFAPDLIAMSATEDMYPVGVNLLKSLAHERPPVVAGGVFPTFAPELAVSLSQGTIDYVLRGEGEDSLVELCRRLEAKLPLYDLAGLYAILDGREIKNPLPKPVDVARIPVPDFTLFEESRYYRPMQGKLRRMLPVQTVRGCPYTCGYCNSPSQIQIHKAENHKYFRTQHVAKVQLELEHAVRNYKADSIYFWADTFLSWNHRDFDEFCEMYSDYKLPFWIQTRPETVTEYKFKRLVDIGLLRVAFGVEHGNEDFRKRILLRQVKNEVIIKNLGIVTSMGVPISVNNIIGFPTETRELAFDTIELNRHFKSDGVNAYNFTPFHGTPLRKLSEDLGYVEKGTLARCISNPTMISMPQFTKEQIEGVRRCFVLYVKMPKERWPEIREAETLDERGEEAYQRLKAECLANYMQYGDYSKEDHVDKVAFEKDSGTRDESLYDEGRIVEMEEIIRRHAAQGESDTSPIKITPAKSSKSGVTV
jgi:anaerobic magnesium-protoporphyrin IX monomethyl ester cyclase